MSRDWTLVYDGECRFCGRWVALIRRWDRSARVRAVAFQDAAAWEALPGLSRPVLESAVHLVSPEGRVYAGAAAAAPLLRLLPAGRLVAAPLRLPGAAGVAAATYRWVARHRHRLGCGSSSCRRGEVIDGARRAG
jgi:predicted DCC family thiol-disulfide oxidoreductase YuxK